MTQEEASGQERLAQVISEALGPQSTEVQSLTPSPAAVTAMVEGSPQKGVKLGSFTAGPVSDEEMAALDTCGKYGGWSVGDQTPCQRPSCFGVPNKRYGIDTGPCYQHTPERLDKIAERKAEFLERFMDQPTTLIAICTEMGIKTSQPALWKLTDLGFRRTYEALKLIVDDVRNNIAEDAMFDRIRDVESGADTLRMFFHQNRSHGRWRDVRKDPAPAGNTTIIQPSGDVNVTHVKVWQVGNDFIDFPTSLK